ncbi:flagellar biosynthetic protein FliO [Massilia sp. IC2-278]|uniref:flagellar biosynthetic protein FliO n=1 Tax=Massilia sp. IC2-278 TaxID=2887200 RepID=UPI001E3214B2|nr:flagellar biosynthetic protein FliO [Massilia sp. IC2-278]MCC2962001.1 flagellar biosynthetic protein FliO [Massilia sp. IC2-278]
MLAAACWLPLAASAQAPASTASAPAPSRATPAATPATSPASSDAQVDIVPPERATTVGEVPTTAQNPLNDPPAAVQPAAPAAIPGTPARPATIPRPTTIPSTGMLMQTIFALLLVLGLLAALAWAAKRWGPKLTGNSANLRLVGALNIGGRERIMVVEVGNQWIVVGASPGRVNALATMPRQEAGVQSGATLAADTLPVTNFSDWLKNTIDKRNAK